MKHFTGVLLAGGLGNRMQGSDKGLILLHGKPLYLHVLHRFAPQVNQILISVNRNIKEYQKSGYQVITDSIINYLGPLAGILSGLQYSKTEWIACCTCDTPRIPFNYVENLWLHRLHNAPAVWVKSFKKDHPTLALVNRKLIDPIENWLINNKKRCLIQFFSENGGHAVKFNESESFFQNINTLKDLKNEEMQINIY
ncbi:molybdenum cofactor guanylyltransferase [Pantoea sp. Aalb]|nr:molybdenum cofactor guanylyltransferase MobA [Pantoea sp. Aalb]MXP67962.1 molybdenum cofactor guanylyltransferase [Pantoea sp. Aalb]